MSYQMISRMIFTLRFQSVARDNSRAKRVIFSSVSKFMFSMCFFVYILNPKCAGEIVSLPVLIFIPRYKYMVID